ncbi:MAG: nucleoside deaminase [Phycisphaerales bacterium]|nr:nucleoside deaminase [Phycisphaerales bacterium]
MRRTIWSRNRRRNAATLALHKQQHDWLSHVDLDMMRRALRLARIAGQIGEIPVAAIVYRGQEIISQAANDREASNDPAGHAELVALRLAGAKLGRWRLNDCRLAVTLEPCPMCAGAIVNSRLEALIFGASDPKAGAVGSLYHIPQDARLNHRLPCAGGVYKSQASGLLKSFFASRRIAKRS